METLSENDIMIQRYVRGNWPSIRGRAPFIVTGPTFRRWTIPHSLHRFGEYRFVPELQQVLSRVDGDEPDLAREAIAELLLREGICEAIWASNVRTVLPIEERWPVCISQLRSMIPLHAPISAWTMELLSGMSDASYYRNYLSESGIVLEAFIPPTEEV